MSFIWMMAAGVIFGVIGKLFMRTHPAGGLFILGIGGSFIAGVIQYSLHQPIGFIAPSVGAFSLLALYAATARRPGVEKTGRDDLRRAA